MTFVIIPTTVLLSCDFIFPERDKTNRVDRKTRRQTDRHRQRNKDRGCRLFTVETMTERSDRQKGRQAGRQTDRQAGRQTGREREQTAKAHKDIFKATSDTENNLHKAHNNIYIISYTLIFPITRQILALSASLLSEPPEAPSFPCSARSGVPDP